MVNAPKIDTQQPINNIEYNYIFSSIELMCSYLYATMNSAEDSIKNQTINILFESNMVSLR